MAGNERPRFGARALIIGPDFDGASGRRQWALRRRAGCRHKGIPLLGNAGSQVKVHPQNVVADPVGGRELEIFQ